MARLSPALKQATPVQAARGEGMHLYDVEGRRYLDFTAGIGVTSTGHCHPRVVAAAQEQVATLIHGQYTTVMHQPLLRLAERLGDVLPASLDSVFFLNSGSEAVEASVRLARHATGRPLVVELNPLPGVLPDPRDHSCFPKAAAAAGMSYDDLIRRVADIAWRRISGRSLLAEVA